MLEGSLFESAGGPALEFSHENLDKILDFSDFDLATLVQLIRGTLAWLGEFAEEDFMQAEIPLINRDLGDLLDFATTFDENVVSRIDFSRIQSLQDFIDEFVRSGICLLYTSPSPRD